MTVIRLVRSSKITTQTNHKFMNNLGDGEREPARNIIKPVGT